MPTDAETSSGGGIASVSAAPPNKVVLLEEAIDHVPVDRLRCNDLQAAYRIWAAMDRGDDGLPEWSQFRHASFAFMIDKLCLLKVRDWRADDMEYATYGGHPADFLNGGKQLVLQELRIDPARHMNYADIKARTGRCVESGKPCYVRKTLSWAGMGFVEYEVVFLPFSPQNGSQRILTPISATISD